MSKYHGAYTELQQRDDAIEMHLLDAQRAIENGRKDSLDSPDARINKGTLNMVLDLISLALGEVRGDDAG